MSGKPEESEIEKAKKAESNRKAALAHCKARVEELNKQFAENYTKGNLTLAAQDARKMAAMMDMLADMLLGE